ncbi:hypothetical protein E3N88_38852 [Mikania micrantha]|uniref:Uncharacterized protein n=1 Tax=Mikania micrantha TaxID=192012 RepID=A0A5N6LVZ9_9ASTR|nr:hypothetical protein E3N88_38852 [Mikania micrantha]
MANQHKQNQSAQRQVNDYEKIRLLRVEENKKKLQELGVKRIANSLTSLVDSQKIKKIVKPTNTNANDVDYIPDMGDDSDGDQQQVATRSKKKHRPHYIAPLSMNKFANIAKQHRVIGPKVSQKFSLDSNVTKENQSRVSMTMAELISSSRGSRKQKEVFKENVTIPNYLKGGAKRRLVLLDEDDDEYDETFQGIIFINVEFYFIKITFHVNLLLCVDQDDEYQDMDDMTFVENENEVQTDDSDDELGIEDDVQIQERLQGSKLEKEIEFPESKKRGPTMLHVVHMRKVDDREMIICNEFGQPVGPVTNEKDVVGRFSLFLGTIARNHSYAPLIHSSWHKVPHKDKIWEYILEKYDVPDAAKKWVLMTIGHSYKVHKCRFKKKHFYQFRDDKTRWKNRPKSIPEGDFAQLLRLWNNTNVKKRCLRAKEMRMSQKNMHMAGPKSFARIRDEMINDDSNKELPTLTKMFEHTRKRTEGRAYVDTYDDTQRKIEQMKNYKSSENESASVDPFTIVMNKENSGYCRLYGRGVTNRLIKKLNGGDTTCTFPGGLMESFNASFEGQKHELLKMRKELDEEHERKKTELEAIQLDIKNQQEHLEATMRKLLEQLPCKD